MDVIVDKDVCIGCGICADKCPAIFALVNSLAVVKTAPKTAEDEKCCREAADDCPVDAIAIRE